jgi:flagellin-like hook-associated protein FlgL
MSDVSLSKAVRSNLLSLKGTADMMAKTQDRLATGNKVNSALDNPTNFFTASALNSRAGDMNQLMDSMANGIQTLEAADNGLSSITKTLESMQSTLRQARQDKSFQTASFTLDSARTGNISLSGGAIGNTPVDIKLTQATPASVTAGISYNAEGSEGPAALVAADAYPTAPVDVTTTALAFTIQGNNDADPISFSIGGSDDAIAGIADLEDVQLDELVALVNSKLADYGSSIRASNSDGSFQLAETDATNKGEGATISIDGAGAETIGYDAAQTGAADSTAGSIGTAAGTQTITVQGVSIDLNGDTHDTAQKAADFINVKLRESTSADAKDVTASVKDGKLVISGPTDGSAKTITVTGDDVFGADTSRTTTTASVDSGPAKTVDALISEINNNNDLKGKVRASNDNGKLRIENLSTTELNVDGVSSSGAVDGTSAGASHILGNSVRSGLADQFNELRDQLDKTADDASFNGINLLRGDLLKITFNETGTSSIDIQTKGEVPLNAGTLNLFDINPEDLDSDAAIDQFLAEVKTALNHVRSQSSTFGSNLSIVQNRQDFTKEMINTLQTGGANLTLADMNEEAANLLALQTRQSLSSNSLSLASQADQSVLQLLQ